MAKRMKQQEQQAAKEAESEAAKGVSKSADQMVLVLPPPHRLHIFPRMESSLRWALRWVAWHRCVALRWPAHRKHHDRGSNRRDGMNVE